MNLKKDHSVKQNSCQIQSQNIKYKNQMKKVQQTEKEWYQLLHCQK